MIREAVNASPLINFSGASVSSDGGAHLHASDQRQRPKSVFPIPLAILLFCTTSQPSTWFTVWLDGSLRRSAASGGYKSTDSFGPE